MSTYICEWCGEPIEQGERRAVPPDPSRGNGPLRWKHRCCAQYGLCFHMERRRQYQLMRDEKRKLEWQAWLQERERK
jgi:hypothetical protein